MHTWSSLHMKYGSVSARISRRETGEPITFENFNRKRHCIERQRQIRSKAEEEYIDPAQEKSDQSG